MKINSAAVRIKPLSIFMSVDEGGLGDIVCPIYELRQRDDWTDRWSGREMIGQIDDQAGR